MSPALIRQVWSTVDTSSAPTSTLLGLSDHELAQQLTAHIEANSAINSHESWQIQQYILEKAQLIKDIIRS